MLHTRTCNIAIISNQPKFPFPTHITVNADFELFGRLPVLAVFSELFRITQDHLLEKKLSDLADVDGMYRDPETFSFYTEKGFIELRITLLPIDFPATDYQIAFHPLQHIHETNFMVKQGYKRNTVISATFGLCMLNVLNPIKQKNSCMIVETDEHVLQAHVVVDLATRSIKIGDTTTPNNMRQYEIEMANLYFNSNVIKELIITLAEKLSDINVDEDAVISTNIASIKFRKLSIREFVDNSEYDNDL